MRQEQIRKAPRRRPRQQDAEPLRLTPYAPDTTAAEDVLKVIDRILEAT